MKNNDFTIKRFSLFNFKYTLSATRILYLCGKDMKENQGLEHWYNSFLKTFAILYYSAIGNRIYAVLNSDGKTVATFQVRAVPERDVMRFSKLAVLPEKSGEGISHICLEKIAQMAEKAGIGRLECVVYEKSIHALSLYEKCGFEVMGKTATRKYTELVLIKDLKPENV